MPKNPILEVYKGKKIRYNNVLLIRVTISEYKNLIDMQEATGLSTRKIIGLSSTPCFKCTGTSVNHFNKDGDEVFVKRGYLSQNLPEKDSGKNRFQHAKKD